MANTYFQFKQFTVNQDRSAMKVTTDACLFGAYVAREIEKQEPKSTTILDIGTGTGLLSLMIAQKTNCTIDAIEITGDSFEQAKENIAASRWSDRINVFHGDAKSFKFPGKYGVIVSNPPFYEDEIRSSSEEKNIAHHDSGLLLEELLQLIKANLDDAGRFYIMLPHKRISAAESLIRQSGLAINKNVLVRQSTKHDYFRIFIEGTNNPCNDKSYPRTEISIWNDQQQYTPGFIELLKDFYLYL
jgi:tRNA1Val (adenine37-N6)-methyltransferase